MGEWTGTNLGEAVASQENNDKDVIINYVNRLVSCNSVRD